MASMFNKIFGSCRKSWYFYDKLYTNNCLELTKADSEIVNFKISYKNLIPVERGVLDDLSQFINGTLEIYLETLIISEGPKIVEVRDTVDFTALENIELNMYMEDYSQPYPTMIIELPENYYRDKECVNLQSGDTHFPCLVIVHHNPDKKLIIGGVYLSSCQIVTTMIYDNPDEHKTIEEHVAGIQTKHYANYKGSLEIHDTENVHCYNALRAGINLLSLLMEYGCKKQCSNSNYKEKLDKKIRMIEKGKIKGSIPDTLIEQRMIPDHYAFEQNIKLFDTERQATPNGENREGGYTIKPHWRRGFRRRQHYGPGNTQTKIVTIKPVFVNRELFSGKMSTTKVTYK